MARAGIRIGLAALGLGSAGMAALFIAAGIQLLRMPEQRVGVWLEFPDAPLSDDVSTARACLPRLLTSTGAIKVEVTPMGKTMLEATFHPSKPWSEKRGTRATDPEKASLLLPDELRTLLTARCDVRFLQVLDPEVLEATAEHHRDRTARLLEGNPDRRLDSLRSALRLANEGEDMVAWCPLGATPDELVPLLVEERDRRVTCADLAGAAHVGSGGTQVELRLLDERRAELDPYLGHLVGRRLALVVDGTVTCVTRVSTRDSGRLVLAGDGRELNSAEATEIVDRVTQPLLPIKPRIMRSWITPTHSRRSGVFSLAAGVAGALVVVIAAFSFARDLRRPPEPARDLDWSSIS